MHLYQYQCQTCTHSFKKLFLIVQDAPFACPRCGDKSAKTVLRYTDQSPDKGIGLWSENRSKWFSWMAQL